jgi:hypothetical protein
MVGKKLTALEMPEEEHVSSPPPVATNLAQDLSYRAPTSIPLPPIPPAPKREIMVQLSVKAPHALVERLERMNTSTGAQKQAIIAAALDAYLRGHGY